MDKRNNTTRNIRDFDSMLLAKMHLPKFKLEIPQLLRANLKLYGLRTADFIIFALAFVLAFAAGYINKELIWVVFAAHLSALLLAGWNVFYALRINIGNKVFFSEELIFTLACLALFAIGQLSGSVFAMLSYRALRFIECFLAKRRYDIRQRLEIPMPAKCRVETESGTKKIKVEKLKAGQIIVVKPKEIIPVDGEIIEGSSFLDTYIVTGSEDDMSVEVGDKVVSGCTNLSETLRIEVTHAYENSTANVISDLLYAAPDYKSDAEKQISLFAGKLSFAFSVSGIFICLIFPLLFGGDYAWQKWIARGALIMALSSLNVLAQTVPFSYIGAVAVAAEQGIILNGNRTAEKISQLVIAAFNKTGTLTEIDYKVTDAFARTVSEEELLSIAAAAEQFSSHPIAKAICRTSQRFEQAEREKVFFEEIPCRGVSTQIHGHHIFVGNAGLLEENGIKCDTPRKGKIAVHVAMDGRYCGYLVVSNKVRDNAFETLEGLREHNIRSLVMLTGDLSSAARKVALSLNMDMVKAELDREGKLSAIAYLRRSMTGRNCFAYVCRKCEDPEFLRQADVGISLGAFGCNEVLECADVLIMEDNLAKLGELANIVGKSRKVININLAITIAVKALSVALTLFGLCGVRSMLAVEVLAAIIVSINTWSVIFNKL